MLSGLGIAAGQGGLHNWQAGSVFFLCTTTFQLSSEWPEPAPAVACSCDLRQETSLIALDYVLLSATDPRGAFDTPAAVSSSCKIDSKQSRGVLSADLAEAPEDGLGVDAGSHLGSHRVDRRAIIALHRAGGMSRHSAMGHGKGWLTGMSPIGMHAQAAERQLIRTVTQESNRVQPMRCCVLWGAPQVS